MFGFSRSMEIMKISFDIMKQDKKLIVFPLLSVIFSVLFMAALLFPTVISDFISKGASDTSVENWQYVMLFITYLGLSFIAVFFNVCVVYAVKIRFEGGASVSFSEILSFAFSKIGLIFMWSAVSATVGVLLKVLENSARKAGGKGEIVLRIIRSIFGMMWGIITIFVVPAMVYDDLGPIDAIKKSTQTLKKTWGESLVRSFGLGLIQFLFIILGVIIAFLLMFLLSPLGGAGIAVGVIIVMLYFAGVFLVFNVVNTIFNTALYVYAEQNKIPTGYNQELLRDAFRTRSRRSW